MAKSMLKDAFALLKARLVGMFKTA